MMPAYAKISFNTSRSDALRLAPDPQHAGVAIYEPGMSSGVTVFFSHECAKSVHALADELDRMAALCVAPPKSMTVTDPPASPAQTPSSSADNIHIVGALASIEDGVAFHSLTGWVHETINRTLQVAGESSPSPHCCQLYAELIKRVRGNRTIWPTSKDDALELTDAVLTWSVEYLRKVGKLIPRGQE